MASWCKEGIPLMAMVIVEGTNVGTNVLFKAAFSMGLNFYVFITYSYLVANLLLFPFIFLFNRNLELPPNKIALICRILILSVSGCLTHICIYKGVIYSSPTLASAMSNLIPAFTFLLAVLFGMEKLAWRSKSTQAKIIGTTLSISGACVVTLYKGPTMVLATTTPSTPKWITGGLLLAAGNILCPIWYIIQAQIMTEYPSEVRVVFVYALCASVMSSCIGLATETNPNAWLLSYDAKLSAVLYSGFFGCLFSPTVHTWALRLKGPVYVAMFKPLSIAIAAIMSWVFLGESLHLGSVIGAVIISVGFYAVLWGKANEEIREDLSCTSPLLPSKATI